MGSLLDFLGDILGIDIPSPREALYKYIVEQLLNPAAIDLTTADYRTILALFATLIVPVVVFRLLFALIICLTSQDLQALKEWAIGAAFTFVGLSIAPGLLMGAQYFFNLLGFNVFRVVLGGDFEEGMDRLLELSGNGGIDVVLSAIQIFAMILLAFTIQLIPIALGCSVVLLLWGLNLNWLGKVGDSLYELSLRVTVYGTTGTFVALTVIAFVASMGRLVTEPNSVGRGITNTLAIALAGLILWRMLRSIGGSLKATVKNTADAGRALKHKVHSSDSKVEKGGGASQLNSEVKAQQKHTHHKRFSRTRTTSGQNKRQAQSPEGSKSGGEQPSRYSSTRERLRRGSSKQQLRGATNTPTGTTRPPGKTAQQTTEEQAPSYRRSRPSQSSLSGSSPDEPRSTGSRPASGTRYPSAPPRNPERRS
jgi:hypothetical protein